jgi:hypothetical protein
VIKRTDRATKPRVSHNSSCQCVRKKPARSLPTPASSERRLAAPNALECMARCNKHPRPPSAVHHWDDKVYSAWMDKRAVGLKAHAALTTIDSTCRSTCPGSPGDEQRRTQQWALIHYMRMTNFRGGAGRYDTPVHSAVTTE